MKDKIIKRLDFPINVMEDMGGDIFYVENTYPLEYSLLFRVEGNFYVIYEIQRSKLNELFKTDNPCVAEIYASMLIEKKLGGQDHNWMKQIDDYIEKNDTPTIINYFDTQSFSKYYSIGVIEYSTISLIIENEKGTVYFHNKEFFFCKNARIKKALSIMANFSRYLERVTELYEELKDEEKAEIDFDDFAEKYVVIT